MPAPEQRLQRPWVSEMAGTDEHDIFAKNSTRICVAAEIVTENMQNGTQQLQFKFIRSKFTFSVIVLSSDCNCILSCKSGSGGALRQILVKN